MSNKAITKIFISGEEHNIGLEDNQISEQLDTRFVLKTEYESNRTFINQTIQNTSKELSDNIKDINDKLNIVYKQEIFDIVHPIGEVYVQFPGQIDPKYLYNKEGFISSEWTIVRDYNGAFFRSEGGDANPFEDQTSYQDDVVGTHKHKADIKIISGGSHSHTISTSFRYENEVGTSWGDKVDTVNPYGGTASLSSTTDGNHTHDASVTIENNHDTNIENRPKNYTIRIWKRTE